MAGELIASFTPGRTVYYMVFNRSGQIWNTVTAAFESYSTANLSQYAITSTEQGTASSIYIGSFPTAIPAGAYSIAGKWQAGSSPSESDQTIGTEDFQWNGSTVAALADIPTSGVLGNFFPIRVARSQMIQNYPIYMKSSMDHVTPFVSGVISGQISRDGGAFGALQSGQITEVGQGFYNLRALTSGDLNANVVSLLFMGQGISGGSSDPLAQAFILQRVSGY